MGKRWPVGRGFAVQALMFMSPCRHRCNELSEELLVLQKHSARLRALRLRQGTAASRTASRARPRSGDSSTPLRPAPQRSRAGTSGKRSRSDMAASVAEHQHCASSTDALDTAASAAVEVLTVAAMRPLAGLLRETDIHEALSPAGASPESAHGSSTRSDAVSPAVVAGDGGTDAAGVADAARRSRPGHQRTVRGSPGGRPERGASPAVEPASSPRTNPARPADPDVRAAMEQPTLTAEPEPCVAAAVRDLTDQVQSLRVVASRAHLEDKRPQHAVSSCRWRMQ